MNVALILVVFVLLLFLVAFFSRRRFGVLGLALSAGYILQQIWEADLSIFVSGLPFLGNLVVSPITIAGIVILIMPSILIIFAGPTYNSMFSRIVGGLLYAVMAVLFGIDTLINSMDLSGNSGHILNLVISNKNYLITGLLSIAIIDIMHVYYSKFLPRKK